jgi:hypothetical protein
VKVTARTMSEKKMGSGICIDTPCLHVLTAYHVVALLKAGLKVEGVPVASILSATGPLDSGSIEMHVAGSILQYDPARDIALLTLKRPLPARFIGLPFATYRPSIGQRVTRIARHGDAHDTATGGVVAEELRYETAGRLVDLDRFFLLDCSSRPGNSGGAVIDEQGRVLGLVEIRSSEESGRSGTAVMGASAVDEFLRAKDPSLWARLFDKPAEDLASAQKPAADWPVELDHPPIPANGVTDPDLFAAELRAQSARSLAAMQRMIALQSMRSWGDGEREQAWRYQVSVSSDGQRFRSEAGRELGAGALPAPKAGILPESEWYDTLSLMAKVRLEYIGASSRSGEPVLAFAFHNEASDETCRFRQRTAALFGHKEEESYVACDGQVVSDEHFNVLGIMLRLSPGFGAVAEWRALARYGLIKLHDGNGPYLLPMNMDVSARLNNGKMYHASEDWSDYHLFAAQSSMRGK